MLTETFGDLLFIPSSDPDKEFSSPESLMKRIIISTKPPQEYKEFLKAKDKHDTSGNIANFGRWRNHEKNGIKCWRFWWKGLQYYCPWKTCTHDLTQMNWNCCLGQEELDDQDDEDSKEDDPKSQQDTGCEYRKLITIHAGKPKGHLRHVDPEKSDASLSETQLAKATSSHGADVIR
jgi:phosphatidylinositol phospholipase C, delta